MTGAAAAAAAERLDDFMRRANASYYARHNPYADFTTAPEISQMFGEILGGWAAVVWQTMGSPVPVLLAEAGPGRGTLMLDIIRTIARVAPAFHASLNLHFVETSPALRAIQAGRLPEATWHDNIAALPTGPVILLANEFLDALPIRQLVRRTAGWMERWVERSRFVELPFLSADPCNHTAPEGTIMQLCEAAESIAQILGSRFEQSEGVALFLDYGSEYNRVGDSLQALRAGHPADPLTAPGEADLTAHVDFGRFADVARTAGAKVHGPVPQGEFLTRLGLFHRTERLARGQPPAQAAALLDQARRLAEPARMGRLFKALVICHPMLPTPPGFEA